MKGNIKKVICNELAKLPAEEKSILWQDLEVAFENAVGESLSEYGKELDEVANELEDQGYARVQELPNGMPRINKGVNFDTWVSKMKPEDSSSDVEIHNLSAKNVQAGNHNTMNVNATPEEFLEALKYLNNNPEEAQSLLSKLDKKVKKGFNLAQTVAKFVAVFGS